MTDYFRFNVWIFNKNTNEWDRYISDSIKTVSIYMVNNYLNPSFIKVFDTNYSKEIKLEPLLKSLGVNSYRKPLLIDWKIDKKREQVYYIPKKCNVCNYRKSYPVKNGKRLRTLKEKDVAESFGIKYRKKAYQNETYFDWEFKHKRDFSWKRNKMRKQWEKGKNR